MFDLSTYVSGDHDERTGAFERGYRDVCTHPKQIGVLEPSQVLVLDLDHVPFHDKDAAIVKANEAANRGVLVGIHTYYPEDPRLQRFLALPNVLVAEDHERLLAAFRQWAKSNALHPVAKTILALPDFLEVSHDRDPSEDPVADSQTGAPEVPVAGS